MIYLCQRRDSVGAIGSCAGVDLAFKLGVSSISAGQIYQGFSPLYERP